MTRDQIRRIKEAEIPLHKVMIACCGSVPKHPVAYNAAAAQICLLEASAWSKLDDPADPKNRPSRFWVIMACHFRAEFRKRAGDALFECCDVDGPDANVDPFIELTDTTRKVFACYFQSPKKPDQRFTLARLALGQMFIAPGDLHEVAECMNWSPDRDAGLRHLRRLVKECGLPRLGAKFGRPKKSDTKPTKRAR